MIEENEFVNIENQDNTTFLPKLMLEKLLDKQIC